eukprot:1180935-Prorocentrum_minimum.AAC.2
MGERRERGQISQSHVRHLITLVEVEVRERRDGGKRLRVRAVRGGSDLSPSSVAPVQNLKSRRLRPARGGSDRSASAVN